MAEIFGEFCSKILNWDLHLHSPVQVQDQVETDQSPVTRPAID